MEDDFLYDYQLDAVNNCVNGAILNGGVGSGKSRTGLYYYYKEYGGSLLRYSEHKKMIDPPDLYIITTAMKRDKCEWEGELANFYMSTSSDVNIYSNKIVIDSWNNIRKYNDVKNAFFIFDEDRVCGKGAWVTAFLKIAKVNKWIILSATPGDTWEDYIPVFIANGFYKNKTDFSNEHCVYSRYTKWPQIEKFINTRKLIRLREKILIEMDIERHTVPHHIIVTTTYDINKYKTAFKTRWDPFKDEPIERAAGLCYVLRRIVNEEESRINEVLNILDRQQTAIIFYNFDYELEMLRHTFADEEYDDLEVAEWNGHMHQEVPRGNRWVYLVQYTAGCEGWNCIRTDTIIFFSQNYSYKVLNQAQGRIDRLNTPFTDLYYYHLRSFASIDIGIARALKTKKKFNEGKWDNKQMSIEPELDRFAIA